MYELVSISCGEMSVQYVTDNLKELGEKFQRADTSRIRHNGKLLTLAEALELLGENSKVVLMPTVSKAQKSSKKANCKALRSECCVEAPNV